MTHRGVLIGCGFFARNHMNAWRDIAGVQIAAVCDTDEARAKAFARDFGAEPYTDAASMLAAVKPDFVDIATTVASHRPLVELAARHARLVVCQKPFAETQSDGEAMVEAGRSRDVSLIVHENFRWQKPYRRARQLIDQGAIGNLRFLRLSFRHAFNIYANQPYLAEVKDLALTDVGLHLFDMVRFLMGDVERVSCETQRLNPRVKGQDAFQALLRFSSGATGSIECSFHSHISPDPFPQTLGWIEGESGTIELKPGYVLRLHRAGSAIEEDCEPAVPAWGERPWHLIQDSVIAFQSHVADVLDGKSSPQPSGAHNLETLALTLQAIEAARTGTTRHLKTMAGAG